MVARNRVEMRGTIVGQEVWSTGVTMIGGTDEVITDLGELQEWADECKAFVESVAMPEALLECMGAAGTIDMNQISVQAYGAVGGIVAQATADLSGVSGTSGLAHPSQSALVFSGRTLFAGASRRGRNYWPATGVTINAPSLRVVSTELSPLVTGWADLIKGLADASPGLVQTIPVVYSPTLDVLTPVSSYQVGDVVDTQRRRRDSLVEDYTTIAYPPPP